MLTMITSSHVNNDYIISHTRNCYLGVNDHKGNRYITPERSPHNHVEFDYAASYETNQQAQDRLLNHNDMLTEENRKIRSHLQQQNTARGRQAHNDILRAAAVYSKAEQNLAEAMSEAAAMLQPSTKEGRQAFQRIQVLIAATVDCIPAPSDASATRSRAP
jgi:hypothetical protein